MEERNGKVELTDDEARLANYYPRFPLRLVPDAIVHMRQRQAELQAIAEESEPIYGGEEHARPVSQYGYRLGELIDQLERLRR